MVTVKRDKDRHIFLVGFVVAAVLYLATYTCIEWLRNRKGPWSVTFINSSTNVGPVLLINQHRLGITNFQVTFKSSEAARASNVSRETIIFDKAKPVPFDVPFGKCLFLDTTFLPGTVTLEVFGHEIELLPRVFVMDRTEYSWKRGPGAKSETRSPKS